MKEYINENSINIALSNLSQIVFEVTDACNLKCKYCAYGELYEDYDLRNNKTLPVEKAMYLIDYLSNFWNSNKKMSARKNIYLSFYGGEPLLNMSFIMKIVDYVNNKYFSTDIHFLFSMTTNALLLNKYMDYLKEHDFSLLISLDGNHYNNSYRVDKYDNNAFDIVVENIDKMRFVYPEYFEDKVNFNAVIHNRNSVKDIYHFFKTRYHKIPKISELNNLGVRYDKLIEFSKTYRSAQKSLYQEDNYNSIEEDMFMNAPTYQSVALFIHKYSGFVFNDYVDLLFDNKDVNTLPTGTCIPFSKKMFVTVNGKILPCERIGHQFALGEITDEGIVLDIEAIARKYNEYYLKFENQCKTCKRNKSCIQCMYNVKDLNDKPICHGYMDESCFRKYINSQMLFIEKNPQAYYRIMNDVIVL